MILFYIIRLPARAANLEKGCRKSAVKKMASGRGCPKSGVGKVVAKSGVGKMVSKKWRQGGAIGKVVSGRSCLQKEVLESGIQKWCPKSDVRQWCPKSVSERCVLKKRCPKVVS